MPSTVHVIVNHRNNRAFVAQRRYSLVVNCRPWKRRRVVPVVRGRVTQVRSAAAMFTVTIVLDVTFMALRTS